MAEDRAWTYDEATNVLAYQGQTIARLMPEPPGHCVDLGKRIIALLNLDDELDRMQHRGGANDTG